ncbi:hypothetical protein NDU88_003155 [Pleurodeles waltl]|uniref:Uncharacterized protein n=1 Tax=Pleurodeles waltl TaxID=8319 RepID=A0AAV7MPR7_PLEWA|nr:hypothetical protein NDU88_003155 [Pleurodeles waltl]
MYDKLEKLMRKELSKWWEIESLQQYIEVERAPRGLRIYTIPSYEDPDPELLEEWAENSKTSSLNMMKILIKYAFKDREKFMEEIDKTTKLILTLVSQSAFEEVKGNLDKKLSKFEEKITVKKHRKFISDFKDYQSGRILTFHHKYDHMYTEDYKDPTPLSDNEMSGSNLRLTEESDASDGNLSFRMHRISQWTRDRDVQQGGSNVDLGLQVQLMHDKFEKLMRKELSKWWEIASLQQYIEVERVPRGLRIYTIPSYEDPDPELLEELAENSKNSSLNMMKILIKYAFKDREKFMEEIDKTTKLILTLVSQSAFEEVKGNLDKKLSKFEEEITVKKHRKFISDFKDYQSGSFLTFHHKYDHMYTEDYKDPTPLSDNEMSGRNLRLTEESDASDGNLSFRMHRISQWEGQNRGEIFNPGEEDEDIEAEEEESCSEGTKKEKKVL